MGIIHIGSSYNSQIHFHPSMGSRTHLVIADNGRMPTSQNINQYKKPSSLNRQVQEHSLCLKCDDIVALLSLGRPGEFARLFEAGAESLKGTYSQHLNRRALRDLKQDHVGISPTGTAATCSHTVQNPMDRHAVSRSNQW